MLMNTFDGCPNSDNNFDNLISSISGKCDVVTGKTGVELADRVDSGIDVEVISGCCVALGVQVGGRMNGVTVAIRSVAVLGIGLLHATIAIMSNAPTSFAPKGIFLLY